MDVESLRDSMVSSLTHDSKALVQSEAIADAMQTVERHTFLDQEAHRTYLDQSFEHRGSTVLAPSTVGRLLEALQAEAGDDVLVVGAGVGYTVGVLAEIVGARTVHAVDISRQLVYDARQNLGQAGYRDVLVDCRDGAAGYPEYAPFDKILVEAAAVRPPPALLGQLAADGQLVMPHGTGTQTLCSFASGGEQTEFGTLDFDPLLVDGEQTGAIERNRTAREDTERAARSAQKRTGWEQDWIEWDGQV